MGVELTGVILAAGRGSRIAPLSDSLPKPLLPILNKPLVQFHLESMSKIGIRKVFIVVEHLEGEIVRTLGDGSRFGISLKYVRQRELLGIAHGLGILEGYLSGPCLVFLGDVYFLPFDLSPLVAAMADGTPDAVLATRIEPDPEQTRRNYAVVCEEGSTLVSQVVEKPERFVSNIKGVGVYLFQMGIFEAIRNTPRSERRNEFEITDSIQILIDRGHRVVHEPLIEMDVNLTFPEDLRRLNLAELKRNRMQRLIGKETRLPEGCIICNSVIGDRVQIDHPIHISDSVVFPNSVIRENKELAGVIVTPERVIRKATGQ